MTISNQQIGIGLPDQLNLPRGGQNYICTAIWGNQGNQGKLEVLGKLKELGKLDRLEKL